MNAVLAEMRPVRHRSLQADRRRRAHNRLVAWGEWYTHDARALGFPSADVLARIKDRDNAGELPIGQHSDPTVEAASRHERMIGLTNLLSDLEWPWRRMVLARYVIYPSIGQTPEIMEFMQLTRDRVYSRLADIHEWLADRLTW